MNGHSLFMRQNRQPLGKFISRVCIAAALCALAGAGDAQARERSGTDVVLPRQFPSLLVAQIDERDKCIRFIPARAAFVGAAGKEELPQAVTVGDGKLLISGRLSFLADAIDVAELKQLAERRFGADAKVEPASPAEFGVWLFLDGKSVWERPVAGGKFEACPVQFVCGGADRSRNRIMKFAAVMVWSEVVQPIDAMVTVDWAALNASITKECTGSGVVAEDALEKCLEGALVTEQVQLSVRGESAALNRLAMMRVREVLSARVRSALLRPVVPSFGPLNGIQLQRASGRDTSAKGGGVDLGIRSPGCDSGGWWQVSFTMRSDNNAMLSRESIDLKSVSRVERTNAVSGSVAVFGR